MVIAFQVGVTKLALISLSFWNGPIILRSKLMKQWVLWQINETQINIETPDVKSALYNIHWDFAVDAIDKATVNIALVCKRFYAYVITREFGLNNNSPTDTYNNASSFSAKEMIDKNVRDLKIKFGIGKIPIKTYRLRNMYWMPKMHKNLLKLDLL